MSSQVASPVWIQQTITGEPAVAITKIGGNHSEISIRVTFIYNVESLIRNAIDQIVES